MSESLHDKHRPRDFDHVLGHDEIVKSLMPILDERKAHTFLFTGPSGTGKTTLARLSAMRLGCAESDLVEIDAATHTGVDAMREVVSMSRYSGFGSKGIRAFIVDEAHGLSKNAWDSLLKSLEEPPEHAFWFLCSTAPAKIPETIKTRCVAYSLRPLPDELIFKLLAVVAEAEALETTDEVLDIIVERSRGLPRQALVDLAACAHVKTRGEALQLLDSVLVDKSVIDLCRWLLSDKPKQWPVLANYLRPLEKESGERLRVAMVTYMTKAAWGATTNDKAVRPLQILDALAQPFDGGGSIQDLAVRIGSLVLLHGYR